MKINFPSWVYHRTLPARIVKDPGELDQLGEGWADTPAAFAEPDPEPVPEPEHKPKPEKPRKGGDRGKKAE